MTSHQPKVAITPYRKPCGRTGRLHRTPTTNPSRHTRTTGRQDTGTRKSPSKPTTRPVDSARCGFQKV